MSTSRFETSVAGGPGGGPDRAPGTAAIAVSIVAHSIFRGAVHPYFALVWGLVLIGV